MRVAWNQMRKTVRLRLGPSERPTAEDLRRVLQLMCPPTEDQRRAAALINQPITTDLIYRMRMGDSLTYFQVALLADYYTEAEKRADERSRDALQQLFYRGTEHV